MTVRLLFPNSPFLNMLANFNLASTFREIADLVRDYTEQPELQCEVSRQQVERKAQQCRESLLFLCEVARGVTSCDDIESPIMDDRFVWDPGD